MARVVPVDTSELDEMSNEAAKAKAVEWREKAIAELARAGHDLDWNVEPVIESFTEVRWDAAREHYYFEVRHSAAGFMNFGTDPHIITPDEKDVLRFVNNQGEEVFTAYSDHPGMPAVQFLEKGRERTIARPEDVRRQLGEQE